MTPDSVLLSYAWLITAICGAVVALAILAACAVARLSAALTDVAEAVKDYSDGSG